MGLQIFLYSLLTLLLIPPNIRSESVSPEKLLELKQYGDKMANRSTLEYGDSCNYTDDLKMREITEKMTPVLVASPTDDSINMFIKEIQVFLDTGNRFCNAKFLLACDEITGRCGCGPKSSEMSYNRENGICRWAAGSQCVSTELFNGTGFNAMCSRNTKCIIQGNGLECKMENLVKGVFKANSPPKCYCSGAGILQISFGLLLLSIFCLYR